MVQYFDMFARFRPVNQNFVRRRGVAYYNITDFFNAGILDFLNEREQIKTRITLNLNLINFYYFFVC